MRTSNAASVPLPVGGVDGRPAAAGRFRALPTVVMAPETLIVSASVFWALTANRPLLAALLPGGGSLGAKLTVAATAIVLLIALHALILAALAPRGAVRAVVALLMVTAALASHYTGAYGTYIDPSMMRNALHTDFSEARELVSPSLLRDLALYAGLPLMVLWRVRLRPRPWPRALLARGLLLGGAAGMLAVAVLVAFRPLAAQVRNQRELRYLVTPANVLWSTASVAWAGRTHAVRDREPIGLDAAPGASWPQRTRPMVLVLVVGETARAANWGLSGYQRDTTPQLARLPIVNFPRVEACGTSTEVSLPCLFAPVGRRAYDEERIRSQQSLLQVLARAGVAVDWRDNQSGCKGVCDGLTQQFVGEVATDAACARGHCLDEALIADLDQRLRAASGTQVWVLHMIGNHGPSYFRRYPPAFARFQPECRDDELARCTPDEIVNAYDNALLFTDHVLAATIAGLQARADSVDSALLYVSDHGESLGEQGLYLHGLPRPIAPDVQRQVPMIAYVSEGFERAAGLPAGCTQPTLLRRAQQPLAHDHFFHTVLGLLDVRTGLHEPSLDLVQPCRAAQLAAS